MRNKCIKLLLFSRILAVTSFFKRPPTLHNFHKQKNDRLSTLIVFGASDSKKLTNKMQNESIPKSVKILGITGGIGSGKSTACQILTSPKFGRLHNCEVYHIDSDSIAHSVYAPGSEAILQIRSEFGDYVISTNSNKEDKDGAELVTIDRKKLGEIVFQDAQAMSVSSICFYKFTCYARHSHLFNFILFFF